MKRISKDEEGINIICEGMGFDPKVAYELTKMMLEQYSRSVVAGKILSSMTKASDQEKNKRQMRKDFLEIMKLPIEESKEMQRKLLWQISEYEWLEAPKNYVLEGMQDYGNSGPIYVSIINNRYMTKDKKTMVVLANELGFSVASLENKKREAIKLFGIMMYRYAAKLEEEDTE